MVISLLMKGKMKKIMVNERQRIDSGESSTNYQANGNITINHGLSYADVKEISMDVFRANFLDLGEEAQSLIEERAEKVITDYLQKLEMTSPESIVKTIDPDIRANIYEVQRGYARRGNDEIENLLVDILLERTIENERDFKNLVLNESIIIASKLTLTQIKRLFLIFVTSRVSFYGMDCQFYINNIIFNIAIDLFVNDSVELMHQDLQYLVQQGCISMSVMSRVLDDVMLNIGLVDIKNKESLEILKQQEDIKKFYSVFEDRQSGYLNATITPVGMAIVISYIKNKLPIKFEYNTFLL